MTACFDRNQARWQNFKFATERCDRRREKPAGDDLPLIVQDAEMAPSVAKINPDSHAPHRLLFCKVLQTNHGHLSLHSLLSCSPHFECRLRQLTASEAHRPSHPILTAWEVWPSESVGYPTPSGENRSEQKVHGSSTSTGDR